MTIRRTRCAGARCTRGGVAGGLTFAGRLFADELRGGCGFDAAVGAAGAGAPAAPPATAASERDRARSAAMEEASASIATPLARVKRGEKVERTLELKAIIKDTTSYYAKLEATKVYQAEGATRSRKPPKSIKPKIQN